MPDKAVSMNGIFSIPDTWIDQQAMAEASEAAMRKKDSKLPAFTTKGGPGSGHKGHKGRPGEIGGSLPSGAGSDIFSEERFPESQIREDMDRIRKSSKEVAYYYTGLGGKIGPLGGDNAYGVEISDDEQDEIMALDAFGTDVALLHNHPSGSPFSNADVIFAVKAGIDEMRVSHPWKEWNDYTLRINHDLLDKSVFYSDVLAYQEEVYEDEFARLAAAIPEYRDRYTEEAIHVRAVKAKDLAWNKIAERWPEWFEYEGLEDANDA